MDPENRPLTKTVGLESKALENIVSGPWVHFFFDLLFLKGQNEIFTFMMYFQSSVLVCKKTFF